MIKKSNYNKDQNYDLAEYTYNRRSYLLNMISTIPGNDKKPIKRSVFIVLKREKQFLYGLISAGLAFVLSSFLLIFIFYDIHPVFKACVLIAPMLSSFVAVSCLSLQKIRISSSSRKEDLLADCILRYEMIDRSISHSISDDTRLCKHLLIYRGELLYCIRRLRDELHLSAADRPMYAFGFSETSKKQICSFVEQIISEKGLECAEAFKNCRIADISEDRISFEVKSKADHAAIRSDMDEITVIFKSFCHTPVFITKYSEA